MGARTYKLRNRPRTDNRMSRPKTRVNKVDPTQGQMEFEACSPAVVSSGPPASAHRRPDPRQSPVSTTNNQPTQTPITHKDQIACQFTSANSACNHNQSISEKEGDRRLLDCLVNILRTGSAPPRSRNDAPRQAGSPARATHSQHKWMGHEGENSPGRLRPLRPEHRPCTVTR